MRKPRSLSAILVAAWMVVVTPWARADDLATMSPARLVERIAAAVLSGTAGDVDPFLTARARAQLAALIAAERRTGALAHLGPVRFEQVLTRVERPDGTVVTVSSSYPAGTAVWTLVFDDGIGLIDSVATVAEPDQTAAAAAPPARTGASALHHHQMMHSARRSSPPAGDEMPAAATVPQPLDDGRTVEFLLATTRRTDTTPALRFTADRSDALTFGSVRVHVPLAHKEGQVERPYRLSVAGFTIYEEKLDEKKHFVVSGARLLGVDDFYRYATSDPTKTALIFVHGFNTSFEDGAYRFAQILYDLQYDRPAILFAWASKGSVVDYLYDKDSAEEARARFQGLVATLHSRGVEKIEVIAHSMGNFLAAVALADSADTTTPDRVDQFIMAAPDLARDYLVQEAPRLTRVAQGITLYACSTDRALQASRVGAGGVPRAGDVPADGPLVLPGIDTIDVSALGQDWFGLNHDVFATNRSAMEDIRSLLKDGHHPPRLGQVRGMPEGVDPPRFWRFVP